MTQTQDGLNWLGDLSDNWSQAMSAWQSLAKAVPGVEDAMSRIAEPSQAFSRFMDALGPGLSAEGLTAAEIVQRWRDAMGSGANDVFAGQFAQGMPHFDASQFAAPLLDAFRKQVATSLDTPAFGPGREQQERCQALIRAQLENQQAQSRYQALLGKVMEQAFTGFQNTLAEHEAPGRQLGSLRAIYDLWIDAAEAAYAQIALSPEFGIAYGEMVNAQMRLRAANQNEVERVCRELGMPTRSEVTAAHRKVHALERSLRALRVELASKEAMPPAAREPVKRPTKARASKKSTATASKKNAPAKLASKVASAAPTRKASAGKKSAPPSAKKTSSKSRKPRPAQAAARRRKGA